MPSAAATNGREVGQWRQATKSSSQTSYTSASLARGPQPMVHREASKPGWRQAITSSSQTNYILASCVKRPNDFDLRGIQFQQVRLLPFILWYLYILSFFTCSGSIARVSFEILYGTIGCTYKTDASNAWSATTTLLVCQRQSQSARARTEGQGRIFLPRNEKNERDSEEVETRRCCQQPQPMVQKEARNLVGVKP